MRLRRPNLNGAPTRLLLFLLPLLGAVGAGEPPMVSLSGQTQGTTYHIHYRDARSRNLQRAIDSLLADIDRCLSTYRRDSELSQFNRADSHRFRLPYFYPVLKKADEVFRATGGAFDPTVLPLVEAYGFGARKPAAAPVNVDSLLQLVGFQHIVYDSVSVRKQKASVRLDFNALAQGFTVDVLAGFLETQGIHRYLVEVGGEIRAKGRKSAGQPWTVGIENPLQPQALQATVRLENRAMATSGNYRNRRAEGGEWVGHILNPRTGLSEQTSLLSATVFAADAMTADAFATAICVLGLEATRELLKARPDLDVFILYTGDDGQLKTFTTPGFAGL